MLNHLTYLSNERAAWSMTWNHLDQLNLIFYIASYEEMVYTLHEMGIMVPHHYERYHLLCILPQSQYFGLSLSHTHIYTKPPKQMLSCSLRSVYWILQLSLQTSSQIYSKVSKRIQSRAFYVFYEHSLPSEETAMAKINYDLKFMNWILSSLFQFDMNIMANFISFLTGH